ncbi:hypothetical protein H5410_062151 [Solanum commersonii]|uniref:Isopenicillin N synthase-like Fe(2+) 2OG dioxygenase domain-containing protein n=1 Tax=Solanum commersonii TaxID=4109 RepID=A0A9J5W9W7_SOLCO|nr:hypothetical protein H5410_062151 [Solanum commersonii]
MQAWTNDQLHSPVHRVEMARESDRYSIQLFSLLKPGHFIEAPKKLVDEEHPLLFKPYEILGLFEFGTSQTGYTDPVIYSRLIVVFDMLIVNFQLMFVPIRIPLIYMGFLTEQSLETSSTSHHFQWELYESSHVLVLSLRNKKRLGTISQF